MKPIHIADVLKLKPSYKWFGHTDPNAEDGWLGPFDHIEEAAYEAADNLSIDCDQIVYVAQGHELMEADRFDPLVVWEVEISEALEINLCR